ncbi:SIS domain-containing protein [Paraclostridium sordellii]|uniref:SIS domain-containing protein n=1 Tax=Paraclostridium sordellii TaxID=1505 RepID=UPI001A9ADE2B|nr:SIS domain-containing protein [Paeniclostridium sordellii]MCR1848708.1 SIS domain-containing protein [Paeniclostridium sordellii]
METVLKKMLGIDIERLENCKGLNTAKEIIQQPSVWKEAGDRLYKNKDNINLFIDTFLKKENSRIILTGAGTSAFAGETCEPYLSKLLSKKVDAIATTDLVASPKNYFIKDVPTLLISFARSGNSPESVHAVKLASQIVDELYQIVITCNENGKLAKNTSKDEKSLLILLPQKTNDLGFAMTSSFTTMVLSCIGVFNIKNVEKFIKDIDKLSESVELFMEENIENIDKLVSEDFDRIIYLGSSTSKAIARESALKVLELTAGIVNASYDTPLGFRHGPKSVINDNSMTVIYISNDNYTKLYDLDLAKEMLAHRKKDKVVLVGSEIEEKLKKDADYVFELKNIKYNLENQALLPIQQIIFGQIVSFLKSEKLGITPDNPCPTGEVNRVVKGVILHDLNK